MGLWPTQLGAPGEEGGVVLPHGGDVVVGPDEAARREGPRAGEHAAEVGVVLHRVAPAPRPDVPREQRLVGTLLEAGLVRVGIPQHFCPRPGVVFSAVMMTHDT